MNATAGRTGRTLKKMLNIPDKNPILNPVSTEYPLGTDVCGKEDLNSGQADLIFSWLILPGSYQVDQQ
jgi:hypothetical protein